MKRFLFLGVAFLLLTLSSIAQPLYLKKDLKSEWTVFVQDKYIPFSSRTSGNTIYLRLSAREYRGDVVSIRSTVEFDLLINGLVYGSGKSFKLPVDSLSRMYASPSLLLAIHQEGLSPERIKTTLLTSKPPDLVDALVKRDSHAFRDFAILSAFILIAMLIMMVRLNPKLAADYLSIPRMFSLREGEDTQLYSRIANSTNILFYVYCSLLISYYLIVIFHFVIGVYPLASYFEAETFGGIVWQWLKLSMIVLSLLFCKIILVFGLSFLFGVREVQGIHFFNWIRMLVVLFGILSAVLFVYFLWHGHSVETHVLFLRLLGWICAAWMVLIFFKLSGRVNASLFHLFSYICATELIPFLIIIKVLYN